MIRDMMIEEIVTRKPFEGLFTINPAILKAIEEDMKEYGYDESAPVILWEGENVVIDGYTRLQAAKNVGLKEISVCFGDFGSEQAAFEYATHNQRNRRNIPDADILRRVETVDKREKTGRHKDSEKNVINVNNISKVFDIIEDVKIPSHIQTAKTVGITPSKVQKVRKILDSGNEELKQEVLDGKKSIHKAVMEIKEKEEGKKDVLVILYKKLKSDINTALQNGISKMQIKKIIEELLG